MFNDGPAIRTYKAGEMPNPLEDEGDGREIKKRAPRCPARRGALLDLVVDQDGAEAGEIREDGATDKEQKPLGQAGECRVRNSGRDGDGSMGLRRGRGQGQAWVVREEGRRLLSRHGGHSESQRTVLPSLQLKGFSGGIAAVSDAVPASWMLTGDERTEKGHTFKMWR